MTDITHLSFRRLLNLFLAVSNGWHDRSSLTLSRIAVNHHTYGSRRRIDRRIRLLGWIPLVRRDRHAQAKACLQLHLSEPDGGSGLSLGR